MIRKSSKRKYLARQPVLIVDQKYESEYFKVSDFPSSLHAGKNMFRLKGNSDLLEKDSLIQVEIMPQYGTRPIFHEVNKYRDSSGRRIITIYVYPEELTGLATVTIVGIAARRPGRRRVRGNWAGRTNVRWQREIYVNPNAPNITPIIFNHQPRITITENVKSFLSESYVTEPAGTITYDKLSVAGPTLTYNAVWPTSPAGGPFGKDAPTLIGYAGGPSYQITSNGLEFSQSMVGGTLTIPDPSSTQYPSQAHIQTHFPNFTGTGLVNTKNFTASIIQVINTSTIAVDKSYYYEYHYTAGGGKQGSQYSTPAISALATNLPTQFSATNYKIEYVGEPQTYLENNYNLTSYANIILANINPMAGDVYRTKISMKSHGIQTWDLLADEVIESREMLVDSSNVFGMTRTGVITNQGVITSYWSASIHTDDASITPQTPILKADSEILMSGMIMSGSLTLSASANRNTDYIKVMNTKPVEVYKQCEYSVAFKVKAFGELDDDSLSSASGPEIRFYISGSGIDFDTNTPFLGRRLDNGQLKGPPPPPSTTPSAPLPLSWNKFANIAETSAPLWPAQNAPAGMSAMSTVATATPVSNPNVPDISDGAIALYDKDYIVFNFVADNDGEATPVFEVKYGKWSVSDITMKASTEGGFTPNHTIVEARVPQFQQDDILDFKIEFFDWNGVRADLIIVSESIDFMGGNVYINGEGYLGEGIIFDGFMGA